MIEIPPDDAAGDIRGPLLDLARRLELRVSEISDTIAEAVHVEAWGGVPESRTSYGARSATRANIVAFVAILEHHEDPSCETANESIEHTRSVAGRGLPLATLLKSYRIAHRLLWKTCSDELQTAGSANTAAILAVVADLMHAFFDQVQTDVVTAYAERAATRTDAADAVRDDTVHAILAGEGPESAAAESRLRYRLDRWHVGFVLWTADDDGASVRVRTAAGDLARSFGGEAPLLVAASNHVAWCWIGGHGQAFATTVLDKVRAGGTRRDGVSVAAGMPERGTEGFRRTHRQASEARRLAELAQRRAGTVVLHSSVAVLSLLATDEERLREFVLRELGPLAANDENTVRLRVTLWTYLREHRSSMQASDRLGIHQNTVTYRVRACEKLLERRVTDRRMDLELALSALQWLGAEFFDAGTEDPG